MSIIQKATRYLSSVAQGMMMVYLFLTPVPRLMAGSLASGPTLIYRHCSAHAGAGLRQLLGWPTVESIKSDAARHSMTAGKA